MDLRSQQKTQFIRFSEAKSVHGRDVDIAISFERGAHGDAYTFKGSEDPVLAHAFPFYAYSGIGGDVHFNGDKNFQVGAVSAERNARFGGKYDAYLTILDQDGRFKTFYISGGPADQKSKFDSILFLSPKIAQFCN
uniref:Peptidase_M10 domain-containing protein n=1 Tax=Steinernema glaseri TaxID=37863 RepID=A0A1I7Y0P5_9BILA